VGDSGFGPSAWQPNWCGKNGGDVMTVALPRGLRSLISAAASVLLLVLGGSVAVSASASAPPTPFLSLNASDPSSYSAPSGSDPQRWLDLSPQARVGTVVGSSGLTYNAATGALEFPGGSNSLNSVGYVDLGSGFNNFGSGITIEFEGHFGAANQAWERIFDFGNGAANDNIWVGVFGEGFSANTLAIELFNGSAGQGRCISPAGALEPNVFAKWVITLDGTSCRMYKNGVQVDTRVGQGAGTYSTAALGSTYTFLPNSVSRADNYIGRSNWGTDAAFNGAIKYVRIYTSALTSSEVAENSFGLTFNANANQHQGGAIEGSIPASKPGPTVVLPGAGDMTRQGFTFGGWHTQASGTGGTLYQAGDSVTLTANLTLYAKWVIPSAARLFGQTVDGARAETILNVTGAPTTGAARGITTNGSAVFFLPSGKNGFVREVGFDGAFVADHAVEAMSPAPELLSLDSRDLTYSSGCIFVRSDGLADSDLYCIDTTRVVNGKWQMSEVAVPAAKGLLEGQEWLTGNLVDFPDGRIGAVSENNQILPAGSGPGQCPTGYQCKILRLYSVAGFGSDVTLTHSEDIVLADDEVVPTSCIAGHKTGWPCDDHGIATDGTYLYQSHYNRGYKVFALRTGKPSFVVFNGDGMLTSAGGTRTSPSCGADTGVSGGLCAINFSKSPLTVSNATFFARDHVNNRYIMADYSGPRIVLTPSAVPPPGPGSIEAPGSPRSATASAGSEQATVSWLAPTSGGAISSYTVTSSPGGFTCTVAATTCDITGLSPGVTYTFSVRATNGGGSSSAATTGAITLAGGSGSGNSGGGAATQPASIPTAPTQNGQTGAVQRPPISPDPVRTPGPLSAPVGGQRAGALPGTGFRASIGGAPVTTTVAPSGSAGVGIRAGMMTLDVVLQDPSDSSGLRTNPANRNLELRVKSGEGLGLRAEGFMPGSIMQVWLPGISGSAELGRVTVGANGGVTSGITISAQGNARPLPVGPRVIQVTGVDPSGNRTVMEMTINVTQSPPTPEPNRLIGALPSLGQGETLATDGQDPLEVSVLANSASGQVKVSGQDWTVIFSPPGSTAPSESPDGVHNIQMVHSEVGEVSGSGFMPETLVTVWFFSDPALVATITVGDAGDFVADFLVDPAFIPAGSHTLQIQGVGTDGMIKAVNLGLVVDEPTTESGALGLMTLVGGLVVSLGLITALVLVARRRNRHA
jgi:uncharacterized repeat protein (TIGR02543 family)